MPILSWSNRAEDTLRATAAPYRLLEPVASLHYGEEDSQNMLIEGDNLDALKALLPYYAGQVKCIFIDPPYNTKSAFEHYDDNLEHSKWLSMMYPRLELLRELLSEDGSMWVTIDDNEGHYLKVLMDEVFGRSSFIGSCVWQKTLTRRNDAKSISEAHDHILVYSKQGRDHHLNRLEASDKQRATYTNRDKDPRGDWLAIPLHAPSIRPNLEYPVMTPSGRALLPPPGRHWSMTKEKYNELLDDGRIYFGKGGDGMPQRKKFWAESSNAVVAWSWWPYDEAGENREAKAEAKTLATALGEGEVFGTPKPERLIYRILELATRPGDLVLDSFLGSGTTTAVAHKMRRRWIGIEEGNHARTLCNGRMRLVVDGEPGGVSEAVGWTGGAGFRYYKLGAAVFDETGKVRSDIKFEHLAAHIWFAETGVARSSRAAKDVFLGTHTGVGYYLLYNGILGDESLSGGNVLTKRLLRGLPQHSGPRVIYGEACMLSQEQLAEFAITFKQTPYDIKAR